MLLLDTDRSFKQGHGDQSNLSLKIGCQTKFNWVKRRLNYERKGEPVECLQKGYGHGQTHLFKALEHDDPTITKDEIATFDKWGVRDDPTTIDIIESMRRQPPATCPLNWPLSAALLRPHLNFLSHGFRITDAENGNFNNVAFECLESLRNPRAANVFLSYIRAPTEARLAHNFANGYLRQFYHLEESFSLAKNNNVFDEEDLTAIFWAAEQKGKVLLLIPQLTEHLAFIEDKWLLCEVDFAASPNNTGRIVFYADSDQNLQFYFYSRAIVQQFVLFGETWSVNKFDVSNDIGSLLYIAISRLFDQAVDHAPIVNRDSRLLHFFAL